VFAIEMNLRKKIVSGYIPVVILLLVIVALSVVQFRLLRSQVEHLTQAVAGDVRIANSIATEILSMRTSVEKYVYGEKLEDKKEAEQHIEQMHKLLEMSKQQMQGTDRLETLKQIESVARDYIDKFSKLSIRIQARNETRQKIFSAGQTIHEQMFVAVTGIKGKLVTAGDAGKSKIDPEVEQRLTSALDTMKKFADVQDTVSRFLLNYDQTYGKKLSDMLALVLKDIDSITELAAIKTDIEDYRDEVEGLAAVAAKMDDEIRKTILPLAPKIVALSQQATDSGWGEMDSARTAVASQIQSTNMLIQLIGIIATLAALALGFIIAHFIIRPIIAIMQGLTESADTVNNASAQVSGASQQLAQASAQQAASIEETSASLEQISSMTQSNAANADACDKFMQEASGAVQAANTAMAQLTAAMEVISGSSRETSKIIKSIDEIAFQTNLLALNAAVEAARAGEAGRGFAVVAGEVKNLASRSAEAARTTSALIANTVQKIKEGADLVMETNSAFENVSVSVRKSEALFRDISASSNEQSQGIAQINRAVSEMDRVVQENSASAEESASASVEMRTQAFEMKNFIGKLNTLIRGGSDMDEPARQQRPVPAASLPPKKQRELPR
jgi:methyl-accepting chemotaxis protein